MPLGRLPFNTTACICREEIMSTKQHRRSKSTATFSNRAAAAPHKMSTASKVAIASAAGVIAATAAGLATTKTGRRVSRNVGKTVSPVVQHQLETLVDTVESALADAGLLDMIPPKVRKQVHNCLVGAAENGNGSAPPRRKSSRTRKSAD